MKRIVTHQIKLEKSTKLILLVMALGILAHTFQTSAMGCYAACAVADYIDAHDVEADCRRVSEPLADAAARIAENNWAREIHQIGPSLSFRPVMNAGDLVKECFSDRVLILGGGMEGERIRIAPPLTIESEDLRDALEVMLSIMHRRCPATGSPT